nr:PIN domain-containing protein [Thermococcus sp.]
MRHYNLFPHDARIIATALEYGTKRIAALDRDFGRAREILELLPQEFWKE